MESTTKKMEKGLKKDFNRDIRMLQAELKTLRKYINFDNPNKGLQAELIYGSSKHIKNITSVVFESAVKYKQETNK